MLFSDKQNINILCEVYAFHVLALSRSLEHGTEKPCTSICIDKEEKNVLHKNVKIVLQSEISSSEEIVTKRQNIRKRRCDNFSINSNMLLFIFEGQSDSQNYAIIPV